MMSSLSLPSQSSMQSRASSSSSFSGLHPSRGGGGGRMIPARGNQLSPGSSGCFGHGVFGVRGNLRRRHVVGLPLGVASSSSSSSSASGKRVHNNNGSSGGSSSSFLAWQQQQHTPTSTSPSPPGRRRRRPSQFTSSKLYSSSSSSSSPTSSSSNNQNQNGPSSSSAASSATEPSAQQNNLEEESDEDVRERLERLLPSSVQTLLEENRAPENWTTPWTPTESAKDRQYRDVISGEFSRARLQAFFRPRATEVARRFAVIAYEFARVAALWKSEDKLPEEKRTRGQALRNAFANLGPVFVKIGQTMAQRGDVIGDEAADALKGLQKENKPFSDELALQTICEDLRWDGPLAANLEFHGGDPTKKALLRDLSSTCVASASLGQVYRGTTWEGEEVAIKVQRPRASRQVAVDWTCWAIGLDILRRVWNVEEDLSLLADEVGTGVFQELDYLQEARNAQEFELAHEFMGFVRTPKPVYELCGPEGCCRVLTTRWIQGSHISDIPDADRRRLFAQMAVDACTCQLLYTGMVHADPHEGNMMLTDKNELYFLDFGLIARVEESVMEGFARGVQAMIAGDYETLVAAFQDVGFVRETGPMRRTEEGAATKFVPCTQADLAVAVREALEAEAGGNTTFGALATGLGGLSFKYEFITPPYIILLCRTFLTLEGVSMKADPNFNIYAASLPYAVRRALAPATAAGAVALRSALLDESNRVRWERFQELMEGCGGAGAAAAEAKEAVSDTKTEDVSDAAGSSEAADMMVGLFGSAEGKPLRAVTRDACSMDLANALTGTSATAQQIRESGTSALAAYLVTALVSFSKMEREREEKEASREAKRSAKVMKVLAFGHLRNLATKRGVQGVVQLVKLAFVGVSVVATALYRAFGSVVRFMWQQGVRRVLGKKDDVSDAVPPPAPA